jgi:hypothetical protein
MERSVADSLKASDRASGNFEIEHDAIQLSVYTGNETLSKLAVIHPASSADTA